MEQRFVDKRGAFPPGRRLGCQATICGDLVVDVPSESQVHRQVVRKPAEERAIVIDPVVRLHTVAVGEPDMREPASDFRRLQEALAEQWGVAGATADLAVLKTLQAALRAGGWTVTVALRSEREIVAISPGFAVNAYGVAVDVGSTTIAAYLCDLSSGAVLASVGAMNPQIRYGEDLMSRVSYAMMHPGGAADMTRVVRADDRRADRRGDVRGWHFPGRDRRGDAGRQSDHAPSRARARSDRARKRALRARDRRARGGQGPRPRPQRSRPAPLSTRCPASPAMSARTRPASCWPRRRILATSSG